MRFAYAERDESGRFPYMVNRHPVCFICGRIMPNAAAQAKLYLSRVGNASYSCRRGQGCQRGERRKKR